MQSGTRIFTNGAETPDRAITAGSAGRSSRDGGNGKKGMLRSPPQYFGLTDDRLPFAPGPGLPGRRVVGGPLSQNAPAGATQRSPAFRCERVGNQAPPSERAGRTPTGAIQGRWRALRREVGNAASGYLDGSPVLHEPSCRASDSGHAYQSGSVAGSNRENPTNRRLVVAVEVADKFSSFAKETGDDRDGHAPLPKKPPAGVTQPAQFREGVTSSRLTDFTAPGLPAGRNDRRTATMTRPPVTAGSRACSQRMPSAEAWTKVTCKASRLSVIAAPSAERSRQAPTTAARSPTRERPAPSCPAPWQRWRWPCGCGASRGRRR